MSLILEALRKSEAERRRGQAPDVAMELPPASTRRSHAMPAWLLPMALLGGIALFAAWWWSQRDTDAAERSEAVAASPAPEPRIETPAQPVVVARPTETTAVATQVAPPATAAPPPPVPDPEPVKSVPPPVQPVVVPPPAPADTADIDATAMPSIKLSMHMWDEAPARRFVILNGQRMGEGDRNGDIVVVAIERDGVVVERNGQRARVPLP